MFLLELSAEQVNINSLFCGKDIGLIDRICNNSAAGDIYMLRAGLNGCRGVQDDPVSFMDQGCGQLADFVFLFRNGFQPANSLELPDSPTAESRRPVF